MGRVRIFTQTDPRINSFKGTPISREPGKCSWRIAYCKTKEKINERRAWRIWKSSVAGYEKRKMLGSSTSRNSNNTRKRFPRNTRTLNIGSELAWVYASKLSIQENIIINQVKNNVCTKKKKSHLNTFPACH